MLTRKKTLYLISREYKYDLSLAICALQGEKTIESSCSLVEMYGTLENFNGIGVDNRHVGSSGHAVIQITHTIKLLISTTMAFHTIARTSAFEIAN